MKKHLGSTIALVLGIVSVMAGLAKPSSTLIAGIVILLGALAYRSAKKRKLREVKASPIRKTLESVAIVLIIALIVLQRDVAEQINRDPVPNLIIPLWAIVAYVMISLRGRVDK